jgi:hypothetical protein
VSGTVRIQKGDPKGLDRLATDALVLYFAEEKAQPQGVPGLVDWRLSGRLARLFRSGRFEGQVEEALLMPGMNRLGANRVFLYGLGVPRARIDDGIKLLLSPTLASLQGAGVERLAVAVAPTQADVETQSIPADVLVRWLEAIGQAAVPFTEITLLEAGEELTRAAPRLKAAAEAAGLAWQA